MFVFFYACGSDADTAVGHDVGELDAGREAAQRIPYRRYCVLAFPVFLSPHLGNYVAFVSLDIAGRDFSGIPEIYVCHC